MEKEYILQEFKERNKTEGTAHKNLINSLPTESYRVHVRAVIDFGLCQEKKFFMEKYIYSMFQ